MAGEPAPEGMYRPLQPAQLLTPVPSDIAIAQAIEAQHITEIAKAAGILDTELDQVSNIQFFSCALPVGRVSCCLYVVRLLTSDVLGSAWPGQGQGPPIGH